MYKISVPIRNLTVTPETRGRFLELLKKAKAHRVFLTRTDFCKNEDEEKQMIESLRDNVRFFEENGLEVGIWVGTTIGHGVVLEGTTVQDTDGAMDQLVGIDGTVIEDTRCPLDPRFQKMITRHFQCLAKTGVRTILIDDDFRLSMHGTHFCCTCDRHMELLQQACGERFSREELWQRAFCSTPNKYRDAWMKVQGDTLRDFARLLRKAVDEIDPSILLANCSPAAAWDVDGTDSAIEISRILAGNNPPLVRLYGAPYIATYSGKRYLPYAINLSRATVAMARGEGVETMSEGDVYPRPRYVIPASHLELYDAIMRADGEYDGILKYMAEYNSSPDFETGYFDMHTENLPLMEEITELFEGTVACGVNVPIHPRQMRGADFTFCTNNYRYPSQFAGILAGNCSVPTVFNGKGLCSIVFAEEARLCDPDDLSRGGILDAVAAIYLTRQGVDVGLAEEGEFLNHSVSFLRKPDHSEQGNVCGGTARLLSAKLKEGATPVLLALTEKGEKVYAYRYENADGQKFLVYTYDSVAFPSDTPHMRGYLIQEALKEAAEWIGGTQLPAYTEKHPFLYILTKKQDDRMVVGLFNCFDDRVTNCRVTLDDTYGSIRFLNGEGHLEGSCAVLDSVLHAYDLCIFEVRK